MRHYFVYEVYEDQKTCLKNSSDEKLRLITIVMQFYCLQKEIENKMKSTKISLNLRPKPYNDHGIHIFADNARSSSSYFSQEDSLTSFRMTISHQ